ncbi:hypothetical protein [Streptomyces halstedii]|uniref:hypothetical protein n=1 Tax=Streptomyces halstedii TaxID=1944 RepID=UPI003350E4EB
MVRGPLYPQVPGITIITIIIAVITITITVALSPCCPRADAADVSGPPLWNSSPLRRSRAVTALRGAR